MSETTTNKTANLLQRISRSPMMRLFLMGMVMLILQIPLLLISNQINERQSQKYHAVHEVTDKWGNEQTVTGPMLIIPYYEYVTVRDEKGKPFQQRNKRYAGFLPEHFNVHADVKHQTRQRGLFTIPLYHTEVSIQGDFTAPDFSRWSIEDKDILWKEAHLVILAQDAHAITERAQINWNNQSLTFEAGTGPALINHSGYQLPLGLRGKHAAKFQIQLRLNGSNQLYFAPLGNDSVIHMQSDWPDPSFNGKWLPVTHSVTTQGFTSEWRIASISRGYGQQWQLQPQGTTDNNNYQFNNAQGDEQLRKIHESTVGTNFLVSIDNYRLIERSNKYDFMFLLLTFLVVWLMEVMTRQRVHFIQYLLMGSALGIFYLLLTALSEHIGFGVSYVLSSLAIVVTVTLYSRSVLRQWKRSLILGGIVTVLYGYLYTVLNEQNTAFLIGTLGLFVALALAMYLTRRIDWYNTQPGE